MRQLTLVTGTFETPGPGALRKTPDHALSAVEWAWIPEAGGPRNSVCGHAACAHRSTLADDGMCLARGSTLSLDRKAVITEARDPVTEKRKST